ncbi:MAG: endonuclease/exonuclease/phosphatase family protein [Balneolaceae bacterium]
MMNYLLISSLAGLILFTACGQGGPEVKQSFSVMSYNLRYDTESDGINQWDNRKERVVSLIRLYRPGFLGIQEGLLNQVEFLEEELEHYGRIGGGRDDGGDEGEFSALYFDTTRFELAEDSEQTLWLSENPGEPGKSWDAALPRILTFGKFRDLQTGKSFYVFNTHFDHIGQTAREESAKLILEIIREQAEGFPVVLTGDFNITEDNPAYQELTNEGSGLTDAYYVSENPHVGPDFTFEGFEVKSSDNQRRIDFIFVSGQVSVLNHAIISSFREGYYPSDHLPVYAVIDL